MGAVEGLFGLAALGLFVLLPVAMVLRALVVGVRALRRADAAEGDRRLLLYLIGAHLCEPLANSLLIPLAIQVWGNDGAGEIALVITLAMAVLLLPALLMRSTDNLVASGADRLVAMGLGRWLWTLLIWEMARVELIEVAVVMILPGTLILWLCARWCAKRIPLLLEAAPRLGALPSVDSQAADS